MSKLILVLNCGSSSIKYAVINPEEQKNIYSGLIENITENSYKKSLLEILDILKNKELLDKIIAIGHRVVHGGEDFTSSVLINNNVTAAIKKNIALAPLHNPVNLLGIEIITEFLPKLPQVAVFDTAFHQTMPATSYLYALPYKLYEKYKIRRYGFHGTSHKYVSCEAAKILNKKYDSLSLITIHLGNGCSMAAIQNGKVIDTSMGLTPLEGLVMGTRSGDLDPAILFYLVNNCGFNLDEVNNILNKKSGLLGISNLSNDMRELQQAEDTNHQAKLARDIFAYRVAKYIGSYAVALGKIDAVIFTGGIGENDKLIREKIISRLAILNLDSDQILVIKTNEELAIALDTVNLLDSRLRGNDGKESGNDG